MFRKFTEKEKKEVLEAVKISSVAEVSRVWKIAPKTIRYWLSRAKLGNQLTQTKHYPNEVKKAAAEEYRSGVSLSKIRTKYGCSEASVLAWTKNVRDLERRNYKNATLRKEPQENLHPDSEIANRISLLFGFTNPSPYERMERVAVLRSIIQEEIAKLPPPKLDLMTFAQALKDLVTEWNKSQEELARLKRSLGEWQGKYGQLYEQSVNALRNI
jgi:transposase-like protein